jgi:hypothetical protein
MFNYSTLLRGYSPKVSLDRDFWIVDRLSTAKRVCDQEFLIQMSFFFVQPDGINASADTFCLRNMRYCLTMFAPE